MSEGSSRQYFKVIQKLKAFCKDYKIKDKFKFTPSVIELFVTLLSHTISYSTIQSNLSAIRHYCKSKSITVTFDTPRLQLVLKGIKKTAMPTARVCTAVRIRHLRKLCIASDHCFSVEKAVLVKACFSLAFFGLLRPCEFIHTSTSPQHLLKKDCIILTKHNIRVTFHSFKHSTRSVTIKIRKLPRVDSAICPYRNLHRYMSSIPCIGNEPLFTLSRSEASSILNTCAKYSHINTALRLHSFRRGGATWLSEQGWSEARLKAQGRWASNAYLQYVKP